MERFVEFEVCGKTIRGIFHSPEQQNLWFKGKNPGIVLCHGFIGNKIGLHRLFVKAARYFSRLGFGVLRFDFSGCGDSDGSHEEITIDGQVRETLAALEFIKSQPNIARDKVFLIGLSMGGAVAALTAAQAQALAQVKAQAQALAGLALWAPVANMYEDIQGIVGPRLFEEVRAKGVADYEGFALGQPFIESLQSNFPLTAAKNYRGPLLVLHGTGDMEISPGNAELYRQARNKMDSTVVSLVPGADHTFSGLVWEEEIFKNTAEWLREREGRERIAEEKNFKKVSGLGVDTWHTGF